jgi:hypothetical protein
VPAPRLTYFVELSATRLQQLLARRGVLEGLERAGDALSVAMLDLSVERRDALRAAAARGIPLTAWLVVDVADGYWMTADNVHLVHRRYRELRAWARVQGLPFVAVGLDLEPPHADVQAIVDQGRSALLGLLSLRRSHRALRHAAEQCTALVDEIRADGYRIETYQYPLVLDERRARSTLLQRTLGMVDVRADRDVLMLYASVLPAPLGDALIDAYPDAEAIAVGVTGGGVSFLQRLLAPRELDLERLLLNLRRARRYSDELYVFSLEGCVASGTFEALCVADLTAAVPASRLAPVGGALRAALRLALRAEALWASGTPRAD